METQRDIHQRANDDLADSGNEDFISYKKFCYKLELFQFSTMDGISPFFLDTTLQLMYMILSVQVWIRFI